MVHIDRKTIFTLKQIILGAKCVTDWVFFCVQHCSEEKFIPIWKGSDEYRILHVIRSCNMVVCTYY